MECSNVLLVLSLLSSSFLRFGEAPQSCCEGGVSLIHCLFNSDLN